MCGLLLVIGLGLPIMELFLLIEVGARIGAPETIFLVMATAVAGLYFVRGQGAKMLTRFRSGQVPAHAEVLHGPLLALAAVCLMLPGFITDTLGLLLLVPPVRHLVARWIVARFGQGPGGPGGLNRPGDLNDDDQVIVITRR
jgi:UPF0716 protein FxsA